MPQKISYASAGVNIDAAEDTKRAMAKSLETKNPLVLNRIGAFASLCDGSFPDYEHPILVCKTEEPGSKQKIAFQYKRRGGICFDMIHHLINDVIVMGAKPLFVQDLIVCGKMQKEVIKKLVDDIARACRAQGCVLTGGETSEQPSVLEAGMYVLGSSCIGVVEKSKIVDGSAIREGDTVLALASSGVHTNGYTLIRALIKEDGGILNTRIGKKTFLDEILVPHRCYYQELKDLFARPALHGMAHITGGGIAGNLNRILPVGLDAKIDVSQLRILPIFSLLKAKSGNDDPDMMKTFNLGVGMTLVVDPKAADQIAKNLKKKGVDCYPIGKIVKGGSQKVRMEGTLKW